MNDTVQYGKRLPPVCLSLPIRPLSGHLFSFILPVRRRGSFTGEGEAVAQNFSLSGRAAEYGFPLALENLSSTSTHTVFLQVDRSGLVGLGLV